MFNYLTPSGSFTVVSRVVGLTPNVSGEVISIPVKTNVPVKAWDRSLPDRPGAVSRHGKAARGLAPPRQRHRPSSWKSNYEQATANVEGLTAQLLPFIGNDWGPTSKR